MGWSFSSNEIVGAKLSAPIRYGERSDAAARIQIRERRSAQIRMRRRRPRHHESGGTPLVRSANLHPSAKIHKTIIPVTVHAFTVTLSLNRVDSILALSLIGVVFMYRRYGFRYRPSARMRSASRSHMSTPTYRLIQSDANSSASRSFSGSLSP